jgi:hypothetical protein
MGPQRLYVRRRPCRENLATNLPEDYGPFRPLRGMGQAVMSLGGRKFGPISRRSISVSTLRAQARACP